MAQPHVAHELLGYSAALVSAIAWAFGSILFRKIGDKASPLGMNLVKAAIGVIYLGMVLIITGIQPIPMRDFLVLALSGFLGIAIGDTFFFKALISLGVRLTLLLETIGPVITVILAVIFLHERPDPVTWAGIVLTLVGVSIVVWGSAPQGTATKQWASGIFSVVVSMLCMSIGIILAKVGVRSTSALEGTFVRLAWGVIGLFLWGSVNRRLKDWITPFNDFRLLWLMLGSVFVVVFGGFWLSLVALKYSEASVATILNSTTPLWILPIAVFFLKEKVRLGEIIGALIAVAGVALIFLKPSL